MPHYVTSRSVPRRLCRKRAILKTINGWTRQTAFSPQKFNSPQVPHRILYAISFPYFSFRFILCFLSLSPLLFFSLFPLSFSHIPSHVALFLLFPHYLSLFFPFSLSRIFFALCYPHRTNRPSAPCRQCTFFAQSSHGIVVGG